MATSKELNDAVRKQFLGIEPKPEVKRKPAVHVSDAELNKRLNRAIGVPLTQPPDPMLAVFERSGEAPSTAIQKRAGGDIKAAVVHSTEQQYASIAELIVARAAPKTKTEQSTNLGRRLKTAVLPAIEKRAGRVDVADVIDGISCSTKSAKLVAQSGSQFMYRKETLPNRIFVVEQDTLAKSEGQIVKTKMFLLSPREVTDWIIGNSREILDYGLEPHLKKLLPTGRK